MKTITQQIESLENQIEVLRNEYLENEACEFFAAARNCKNELEQLRKEIRILKGEEEAPLKYYID